MLPVSLLKKKKKKKLCVSPRTWQAKSAGLLRVLYVSCVPQNLCWCGLGVGAQGSTAPEQHCVPPAWCWAAQRGAGLLCMVLGCSVVTSQGSFNKGSAGIDAHAWGIIGLVKQRAPSVQPTTALSLI